MKVLLINGSSHEKGCTYTALSEVAGALESNGIRTEIFQIGAKPVRGCIGCGGCVQKGSCVFEDDILTELSEKVKEADGYVFGSPVYYASPNGALLALMDRLFYSTGKHMRYKPAAAVCSARRAGTTATLDVLNKYFTINQMPVVSGRYWNDVFGSKPEDVMQDEEGRQNMRTLGNNMAWVLKNLEAGKNSAIAVPELEPQIRTNFIR